MLRWLCLVLVLVIVAVSVLEYVADLTPLEQITAIAKGKLPLAESTGGKTIIRLGAASWQLDEFDWQGTIDRYMADHPDVEVRLAVVPDATVNTMVLCWIKDHPVYDVVVAWSDVDITPIIEYQADNPDPAQRGLAINVRDYLTPQQLDAFMPAVLPGCSRTDPKTGQTATYEMPWMGEVLALNYNRKFFAARNIAVPKTWEEVEEACKKLSGLEYNGAKVAPLAINLGQTGFFTQNGYIPILAAYKGNRGIADEHGRLDVSSPEAAKVFTTLKRWYDAGYISPNAMSQDAVEQDLRVLRAAMYPHWQSRGLWAVKDHGPAMIGLAPTPGSQISGSLIASYGCVIPKCSPVIRPAAEFAYETFCTDKYGFQTAVANGFTEKLTGKLKGGGKMPAIRSIYDRTDLVPGIVDLKPALEKGYGLPDPVNYGQVSDILVVEFQKYLSGTHKTPEAALAEVRRRLAEEVYTK